MTDEAWEQVMRAARQVQGAHTMEARRRWDWQTLLSAVLKYDEAIKERKAQGRPAAWEAPETLRTQGGDDAQVRR